MSDIGKLLLITGLALALAGAVLIVGARLGLGRLPGDIAVSRGNVSVAFPIVTCIVVSIVLTVVINLVLRLRG
ncbi:MAG: DUF2905 domain-containing protein [Candidatus Dormibacteraeota bacterium]|nr:DUF2905 domain-containing protein [Candidatus Dormibacteraeota bacterium]MBV9526098.1 DUF2905 domain-containing protein [Candidatus Dormibacteraeota bacterium]